MAKVDVCKSCLRESGLEKGPFLTGLKAALDKADPKSEWRVDLTPCLMICPKQRLSLAIDQENPDHGAVRTMSEAATIESVVETCLRKN